MTWAKLDDAFPEHPKIDRLSDGAFRLHVQGICWSCKLLTDGFIPEDRVARLTPRYKASQLKELLVVHPPHKHSVWEQVDGGYRIHDFLAFQQSAAKVEEDRLKAAERMRRNRERSGERSGEPPSNGSGEVRPPVRPTPSRPDPSLGGNTPSLATESVGADPGQGGSGYAEEPPDDDDGETLAERHERLATGGEEPPGLRQVDALLRKVCPPKLNRLYGSPRSDLRIALRKGADLDLILAAIRQGDPGEGATLRWQRAQQAIADGKVPTGGGVPARPYEAPAWETEEPPDPAVVAEALAEARAAIRR